MRVTLFWIIWLIGVITSVWLVVHLIIRFILHFATT